MSLPNKIPKVCNKEIVYLRNRFGQKETGYISIEQSQLNDS